MKIKDLFGILALLILINDVSAVAVIENYNYNRDSIREKFDGVKISGWFNVKNEQGQGVYRFDNGRWTIKWKNTELIGRTDNVVVFKALSTIKYKREILVSNYPITIYYYKNKYINIRIGGK